MPTHKEVTFLVIEDDDLDFKTLTRSFRNLRMVNPVRRAMDGLDALNILRGENGAERVEPPYLIILDLTMPRMSGFEFLDHLRIDPELSLDVVFILTSSDSDEDITEAYRRHIAGYIKKSDPENTFLEALSMIDTYWRVVELPK